MYGTFLEVRISSKSGREYKSTRVKSIIDVMGGGQAEEGLENHRAEFRLPACLW